MHDSASLILADWPGLLVRLAGSLDLEALALETRALVRRRGVPDAKALLRLALARGPGGISLRQIAAWAQLTGVADLTDASLNDRLHQSRDFLAAIVASLLHAKAPCPRFRDRSIRVADGSCVSKPGSRGTDWRVHGVYDLGSGGFSNLELTDKHGGDALDRSVGIEREILIADRGYSAAKALRRFMASAQQAKGADYLVRLRWTSLRLRKPHGEKFELIAHLQNMPKDQNIDDIGVLIDGAGAPNIPKPHHHRPMRSDNLCDLLFRQNLFPLPRVALAEKRLGGLRPLIEAAFGLLPGQRREEGFFDRRAKLHRPRFETQKARQTREAAFRRAASRSS
jgi:hypothetical protein